MWAGVEPERGHYNASYLKAVQEIVEEVLPSCGKLFLCHVNMSGGLLWDLHLGRHASGPALREVLRRGNPFVGCAARLSALPLAHRLALHTRLAVRCLEYDRMRVVHFELHAWETKES